MSELLLTELSVAGWKSFRDASITFGRVTLLIGANGSGKSNLLTCFSLIRAVAERRLIDYWTKHGRADQLLHYGPKKTEQIEIGWTIDGKSDFTVVTPGVDPSYVSDLGSLNTGVYLGGRNDDTVFERDRNRREARRDAISKVRL